MKDIVVILGSAHRVADRAALSLAMRGLKGRTRALCADEAAIRYALGAGVEARWLLGDHDSAALTYDVALVGSCDDIVGATLAESRNAMVVCDVLEAAWVNGGDLNVKRDLGRGAKDVLQIKGPSVLYMSDEAQSELYVSRYRRSMVTQLPSRDNAIIESEAATWQPVRPRTKTSDIAAKTAGSATNRSHAIFGLGEDESEIASSVVQADAVTCAQHLIRYLAHHGFIDSRGIGEIQQDTTAGTRATPQAQTTTVGEVSGRVARGPRPLQGSARGMHRRPVPYRGHTRNNLGKLARSPRPIGQAFPDRVRGPFPVGAN